MAKADAVLRREVYPQLEAAGFAKAKRSREFAKVENGVLCAFRAYRAVDMWRALGVDGLGAEVGIVYPFEAYGLSSSDYDHLAVGIAGCLDMRGFLQRATRGAGGERGYIWDFAKMTPEEAAHDMALAVESAGMAFFELWTNPERAWETLHSDFGNDDESEVGGVSLGKPRPDTVASIEFHLKVAARLGKVQEEIDLLHKLSQVLLEMGLDSLGANGEARLRKLEKMI